MGLPQKAAKLGEQSLTLVQKLDGKKELTDLRLYTIIIGCSETNKHGNTERTWKKNMSCSMTGTYSDAKSFEFEKDLLRRFFEGHQSSWRRKGFSGRSLRSR
jgi:hypothetical protein